MLVVRSILLVGYGLNILGDPDINQLLTITVWPNLLDCTWFTGYCAQEHSFQYPMNFREALEGSVDSAVDAPLPSYIYNCDRVERTTTHTNVYKSNLCANRSSSQLYIEVSSLYIHCSNILTLLVRIVGLINLAASHKFQYTAKTVQLKGN